MFDSKNKSNLEKKIPASKPTNLNYTKYPHIQLSSELGMTSQQHHRQHYQEQWNSGCFGMILCKKHEAFWAIKSIKYHQIIYHICTNYRTQFCQNIMVKKCTVIQLGLSVICKFITQKLPSLLANKIIHQSAGRKSSQHSFWTKFDNSSHSVQVRGSIICNIVNMFIKFSTMY